MMTTGSRPFAWGLACFLLLALCHHATADSTSDFSAAPVTALPTGAPVTALPTGAPVDEERVEMGWEATYVLIAIIVMLTVLIAGLGDCMCVIIAVSTSFYALGIISLKELFSGFSNEGVLSIVMLFVVVHPIAELPLIRRAVKLCLRGVKPGGNMRFALFNICLSSMLLSSFLENIPQVAIFTGLIRDICIDLKVAPSQLLLPMDYSVLIGNYAIIGSSNNLVISGLMDKFGMGEMPFFELIKVNGLASLVALVYLVFMPRWLLPRDRGGLLKAPKKEPPSYTVTFRLLPGSHLIGHKPSEVPQLFPGDRGHSSCSLVAVQHSDHGGAASAFSADPLREGDYLTVKGSAEILVASTDILRLQCLDVAFHECSLSRRLEASGSVDHRLLSSAGSPHRAALRDDEDLPLVVHSPDLVSSLVAQQEMLTLSKPLSSQPSLLEPRSVGSPRPPSPPGPQVSGNGKTSQQLPTNGNLSDGKGEGRNGNGTQQQTHSPSRIVECSLVEAVVSPHCPLVGTLAVDATLLRDRYRASLVALRRSYNDIKSDVSHPEIEDQLIAQGNVLLLLAEPGSLEEFLDDFTMIQKLEDRRLEVREMNYFRFSAKLPFGRRIGEDREHKWVRIPIWWPYLSLVAFFGVVAGCVLGVPLAGCCIVAVVALVACGVVSAKDAVYHVDWSIFVLVSFSFGIGISVDKSGLAAVIGQLADEAHVTGFSLLLLISVFTTIVANLVSNKTAAQVMFPIVFHVYRLQKRDPLPGVMVLAATSCMALSTPYGYATNVMVMEPGGYTPLDYLRFGVPLNALIALLVPFAAWLFY